MGFLQCRHLFRVSVFCVSYLVLQRRVLRLKPDKLLVPLKRSLFRRIIARLNRLIVRLHLLHQGRGISILDSFTQFCEQPGNSNKSI